MDKLPEKVKTIDTLRIERGYRKACQCLSPQYIIDQDNRFVFCAHCDAIVDAFNALVKIAEHYEYGLGAQVQALLEQKRELLNYKPYLLAVRDIESYCRRKWVPACPKCNQYIDIKQLHSWRDSRYVKDNQIAGENE